MTLRLRTNSAEERHAHWMRIIERIYREQRSQAWSHYLFRLTRAVFAANSKVAAEGGYVFEWIAEAYADSSLMLVRRELDQQAGAENLTNLLFDIAEHSTVLNRARYRAQWAPKDRADQRIADHAFDTFAPRRLDSPEADHVDPDVVKTDLATIATNLESLREYAERTRAHRTPERGVSREGMTYQALHRAIADVQNVVGKYYALLTQSVIVDWEPVPQYDPMSAFLTPWVVDREAVERALKSDKQSE